MKTELCIFDKSVNLLRFPPDKNSNNSLQAWDSADEYLIETVEEMECLTDSSRILIINDQFGALSCWFHQYPITSQSDSWVSALATQFNAKKNDIDMSQITFAGSHDSLQGHYDLVLIKVPKNNTYLEHLLCNLKPCISDKTHVIAAGKTTDIHTSTLKIFEKIIGETKTSLAKKKSRLIFSTSNQLPVASPDPIIWQTEAALTGKPLTLINFANVFSAGSLDIGARAFIPALPSTHAPVRILDLGCGNGVIGQAALLKNPDSSITFVDESYAAIASAKASLQENFPDDYQRHQFILSDSLSELRDQKFDLVLCNPPFHQQKTITDHIAMQMFTDARHVLNKGGELRIVGNRHLQYHVKLKRLFGHVTTVASNKKFVVLSCVKR